MKEIPLTRGYVTLVDDEDYDTLSAYDWYAAITKEGNVYAARCYVDEDGKAHNDRVHRVVTNAPKGAMVDHKNHNTLDNRKENLRVCTRRENAYNQRKANRRRGTSSQYKGVHWEKNRGMWRAEIRANGKFYSIGRFESEVEAAVAYNDAAMKLHGEFAWLNAISS